MLPDKVDHLLEELEQRLVLADTAPNHHAGVVLSGQRLDDRCFGVLVGCHQAQVGLDGRACHTIPMLPQVVPDVLDSRPPGPTPFVLSSASCCLFTCELRRSRADVHSLPTQRCSELATGS